MTTENAETKAVIKRESNPLTVPGFGTEAGFALIQRQATMLSRSELIPKAFQGNVAECCIGLEIAARIGASAFLVLQNLAIIHGKPSWSAQFLVACVNASGHFSPLRYKETGKRNTDSWGVVAWAKDINDGEVLKSPEVTIDMAKKEGWYGKNGSKWKTIPELMLRYRAATFFARTYCPEITMGMQTREEIADVKSGSILSEIPCDLRADQGAEVIDIEPEKAKETGDTAPTFLEEEQKSDA